MLSTFFNRRSIQISKTSSVYKDCSELPVYNWIKLAVTGDLQWLMKEGGDEGIQSNETGRLQSLYEAILAEYGTLIKDTKTSQELRLKIDITTIAHRIDHVRVCVNLLRIERDEKLIDILRTKLGFARLNYEDLKRDLDLTETYLKADIVKFEQRKGQYEKLTEGEIGSGTEADFYEQVAILSKWLTFGIDVYKTSVLQYVSYLNQLKNEIKNQNNK